MDGPGFVVIGAAKAATTSLCLALGKHPRIHFPVGKEVNFFSIDEFYNQGIEWYHARFRPNPGDILGEGSVSYSLCGTYPETVERMREYRPEMKIIYIVRHPVERLVSHYLQLQAAGRIGPISFHQALRTCPELLDSARYWRQIRAYQDAFPVDQIKVLFFDDWLKSSQAVVADCCRFLGVDSGLLLPISRKGGTVGQQRDSRFLWTLRALPGFAAVRDAAPPAIRRRLRAMFKKPIEAKPEISAETLRVLEDEIGEDVRKFLAHYGRPNLWSMPSTSSA